MRFNTLAIHAGQQPDPQHGAVCVPVIQSTTFAQRSPGEPFGDYDYTRAGNPTRTALEQNLAALEGGTYCRVFSSGLSALQALITLLKQGEHAICSQDCYGGTWRLFSQLVSQWGISIDFVDTADIKAVSQAIRPETRLVFAETPTNPLMRISDIEALAAVSRSRNILLAVDNTFSTPFFQRPLELGADIVLHSCTKYLGGHSDLLAGALVTSRPELEEAFCFAQKSIGAVPGPTDCSLLLRSTKTLGVRMERHYDNALRLAHWLKEQDSVTRVHYPGLPDHPQFELARKQMLGFGGMLSFELLDGESARHFCSSLKLITLAESLGGVESLVNHPASMTHASLPAEYRERIGLGDNLVRLSVGIEDVKDLQEDLAAALAQLL